MSCEQDFAQLLKHRGLRLTPQREMVLSVLHEVDGLTTAEAIYEKVGVYSSSVDISTVYRTLELLQDLDLVTCISIDGEQRQYKLLTIHEPHIHLVCRACGRVMTAELDLIEPLIAVLQRDHGFSVDRNQLSVQGWCPDCTAKNRG